MGKKKKKIKKQAKKQAQQIMDLLASVQVIEVDEFAAAATTIGILTAAHGADVAHDADEDCAPHHRAESLMIQQAVENPLMAMTVIHHLASIAGSIVDDEDIQRMAMDLAEARLNDDD